MPSVPVETATDTAAPTATATATGTAVDSDTGTETAVDPDPDTDRSTAAPVAGSAGAAAAGEPGGEPERRAGRRRLLGRLALAAAMVLLIVGALLLGLRLRDASLDDDAREQALAAAKQSALNLTSIDRENFDDDVARVLDGATGEFRQDFTARVGELEKLLEENEVTAEGRVLEAGIVRSDRSSATALVVVDSTVRNTAVPDGRVSSYRMKLELEKVGDQWMTSTLDFVG